MSVNRKSLMPVSDVSAARSVLGNCFSKDSASARKPARRFAAISALAPSAEKKASSSYANDRRIPDAKRAPYGVGDVAWFSFRRV